MPTVASGTQRRSSRTPGSTSSETSAGPLRLVPAADAVGEREQRVARRQLSARPRRARRLDAVELDAPSGDTAASPSRLIVLDDGRRADTSSGHPLDTGTTRIDEAPAASSSGSSRQTSADGHERVHRDHPRLGERQHARRARADDLAHARRARPRACSASGSGARAPRRPRASSRRACAASRAAASRSAPPARRRASRASAARSCAACSRTRRGRRSRRRARAAARSRPSRSRRRARPRTGSSSRVRRG